MTGVAVVAAVLATACALRLMAGPIDLNFLKPHFLNQFDTLGGPVRVDADRISAEWGGLREPMRVVFTGLHVTDVDGQEIATAPSIPLSFDPRGVVRGHLLPTAIVVERPTLDADITRDGGMLQRVLAKSDAGSQGEVVDLLIDQLLAEHNYLSAAGSARHGRSGARLAFRCATSRPASRGSPRTPRRASGATPPASSSRPVPASSAFAKASRSTIRLPGTYARDRSRVSIEAGIDGFKPSMLAELSPDAVLLRGVDIALSGRLRIEATGHGEIRTVTTEVNAGAGTLTLPRGVLPGLAQGTVGQPWPMSTPLPTPRASITSMSILGAMKIAVTGTGLRTEQGQSFTGRAEIKPDPGRPAGRLLATSSSRPAGAPGQVGQPRRRLDRRRGRVRPEHPGQRPGEGSSPSIATLPCSIIAA